MRDAIASAIVISLRGMLESRRWPGGFAGRGRARAGAGPRGRVAPGTWGRGALVLVLALLVAGMGPGGAAAQVAFPPQGQLPELAQLLDREGTYVAPRVRQQVPIAAEEQLQDAITRADERGVTLRIAVLDQTPGGYADLGAFADALLAQMSLRDGLLVVATPQTLDARSDRLPPDRLAPFAAAGQAVLTGQGIVAGVATTADGALDSLAALVTPEPRLPPDQITVNVPMPAATPASRAAGPPWPALVGMLALVAGLGVYWWTTTRRWREVLGALEGAQAAAERLAADRHVAPATAETAQRRLAIGERALATLRTLPWWHVWVWPWAPPPQLALAERAFSETLRLLGGPGAVTLAPAGAVASGGAARAVAPVEPVPALAPPAEPVPPDPLARASIAPGEVTPRDAAQPVPAAPPVPGESPAGIPLVAGLAPTPTAAPPPANLPPATEASVAPPAGSAPATIGPGASLTAAAGVVPGAAPGRPPVAASAAPAAPGRGRWWQRRPRAAGEPLASLSPEHVLAGLTAQEPMACFFCGLPLRPEQAEVGAVALGGLPLRPLACHRHAALLAAGERPRVRARLIGGYAVPWFQDATFQPAWDFDPGAEAPSVAWDELPPPDRLFEPPPRVVVHADDPRWAASSRTPRRRGTGSRRLPRRWRPRPR